MLLVAKLGIILSFAGYMPVIFQRAGKGRERGTEAMAEDRNVPAGSGLHPLVNSPGGTTPSKALALTLVKPARECLAAAWACFPQ